MSTLVDTVGCSLGALIVWDCLGKLRGVGGLSVGADAGVGQSTLWEDVSMIWALEMKAEILTGVQVFDLGVFEVPGICKQRSGHELC